MSNQMKQYLIITGYLLLPTAVLALVVAVTINLKDHGCKDRWNGSGVESRYVLGRGCLVQIKQGLWVPEKNARIQADH